MSVKISGQVWDLALSHGEKLVLLAMADHADHEGNNVFPSLQLIAWKTDYEERQVRRIVEMLEGKGVLVPVRCVRGLPTVYRIDTKAVPQKMPFSALRGRPRRGPIPTVSPENTAPKTPDILSHTAENPGHFDQKPRTFTHKTPDIFEAAYNDAPARLNRHYEPSIEPEERGGQAPLTLPLDAVLSAPKHSSPKHSGSEQSGPAAEEPEPVKAKASESLPPKIDRPLPTPTLPSPSTAASLPKPSSAGFVPPTLEEAEQFFATLAHPELAADYHDYFTGNGWMTGRNKVKDWHATARRWVRRETHMPTSTASYHGVNHHVPSAKSVTAGHKQPSIHEYRKQHGIASPTAIAPPAAPGSAASGGAADPSD